MNIIPILFLIVITIAVFGFLAYHLFYMPEFFKRMPKKEEFRKRGTYEIYTFRTGPGEGRTFGERYHGSETIYGKAYLKARMYALKRDLTTENDGYGIVWNVEEK